jgi:two-component system, cell cycle response regulator DivK
MAGGSARERDRPLVLVVDDSTDNRTMYAEYLGFAGFEVLEAESGTDAIASARRHLPDAIVMDVGLPAVDGIEATKILRADTATARVVVLALSGHGVETETRAREAGVDLFVRKPCLPVELVVHLRTLLGK